MNNALIEKLDEMRAENERWAARNESFWEKYQSEGVNPLDKSRQNSPFLWFVAGVICGAGVMYFAGL